MDWRGHKKYTKKSTSSNSTPFHKKPEHTDFLFSCGDLLQRRAWHVVARGEQLKTGHLNLRNHHQM